MARGTGPGDANEALELFLDTISNTFGGVLFIAVLVCILAQNTGQLPASRGPEESPQLLRSKLELLKTHIASMEARQIELDRRIKSLIGSGADRGLVVEYAKLTEQEREELARLLDNTERGRKLENAVVDLKRLLAMLRDEKGRLETELKGIQRELASVSQPRPQRITLPQVRTAKDVHQIPILLSGQRMTFLHNYDQRGEPVGTNDAEVKLDQDESSVMPRAGRGLIVADTKEFHRKLKVKLTSFRNAKHYFAIAVWPDSFAECAILRDAIIDLGFKYFLILQEEGKPVRIGAGVATHF